MTTYLVRSAMAQLLLGICFFATSSHAAYAETQATSTVQGQLSVSCQATKTRDAGLYVYRLAGKRILSLSSDCDPDMGTSFISIEQVFRNKSSTTLLIIEGITAISQNIRVLHIPKIGPISVVDSFGGDGYALVMKSPTTFRLISPGGGFAISENRMSTWTCEVEIDFISGTANGDLAVPFEPGLPNSVCEAEFKRVRI